jgi:flagellar motor switch protein FliM
VAKILSQDEIDALLTTVSSPEPAADTPSSDGDRLRSVVAYDFKHPNRVSKDQIRTLENMHDNFAGHFGSALSSMLRSIVDVDLVSVDQITYSEFILSLVSPSCTYTFAAAPMEGVCLVDFNPTLTFSIIDRMFGGHGKILETERDMTGIERSVMTRVSGRLYTELQRSWEHLVKIEIEERSFETNPHFIQIVPPGESVVVISFQVKLFQSTGLLTICYPYVSLEPIITKLSGQNWMDATKKKNLDADRRTTMNNLREIDAEVAAVLCQTQIKVRDFMALNLGDIIRSDSKISVPIEILVNRRLKYTACAGVSGKKRAIQVLDVRERDKEENYNG